MNPNLDDIYALLNTQRPPLVLRRDLFAELGQVLDSMALTQLPVNNPRAGRADGAVTLGGTVDLPGVTGAALWLQVTGEPALRVKLTVTLPPAWQFANSFPDLPPSLRPLENEPGLLTPGLSVLADLQFLNPTLVAQNYADGPLAAGLNFTGQLADNAWLNSLGQVLNTPATPTVTGAIRLHGRQPPEIRLKVALGSPSLQVGRWLTLDRVALQIRTGAPPDGWAPVATLVDLAATLNIGTTDPVPVQITSPFYNQADSLSFTAVFPDDTVNLQRGIDALVDLAGGAVADLRLPPGIDFLNAFCLKEFSCDLDPVTPDVRHMRFFVHCDRQWQITSDIGVGDLGFGWLILFPFDGDRRSMSAVITGTLTFGKIRFDIEAFLHEGFTIRGALRHGDQIHLTELIETALGRPVDNLPQVDIVALEITAGTNGDFDIAGDLSVWDMHVGGQTLALDQLSVACKRESSQISGEFTAVVTIGGARLYVSAGVPTPGQGFAFSGGTWDDEQEINLTAVGKDLLRLFGVPLPPALPDVILNQLNVTFNTQSKNFTFTAKGSFNVSDRPVGIWLDIALTHRDGAYTGHFAGKVTIDNCEFALIFDKNQTAGYLIATYANQTGHALDLKGLVGGVASDLGELIPDNIRVKVTSVKLIMAKRNQAYQFIFGLDLADISFANLPLIGDALPAVPGIRHPQVIFLSAQQSKEDIEKINDKLPENISRLPCGGLASGISLAAELEIGSDRKPLLLNLSPRQDRPQAQAAPLPADGDSAAAAAAITWFDIGRSLGPVHLARAGVQFQNGRLRLYLDSSFSVAGVTLQPAGLGADVSLTDLVPEFHLDGAGLAYRRPPLLVGGAFRAKSKTEYQGAVALGVGDFVIAGLGAYEKAGDQVSLFIFAQLNKALGGAPCFFVLGLMAGFGFNRRLRVPDQNEVYRFPLLSDLDQGSEAGGTPLAVLQKLDHPEAGAPWTTTASGESWVAAGLLWNTYGLIHARALAIGSLGKAGWSVALVGLGTLRLPPTGPRDYVYVELQVLATVAANEGIFKLAAVINPNSYILDKNCKLSGALAFFMWLQGDHAGDFVASLGGYHPSFRPPSHYPEVPRLGIHWPVSAELNISGTAYFALTPACIMAGGTLAAAYNSSAVQARFTVHADFLLQWKPFHYDTYASVSVWARCNVLIPFSVEVGAMVHLWGPPLQGEAEVHLLGVSLSVRFGQAGDPEPAPRTWVDIEQGFLPQQEGRAQVVRLRVAGGLIAEDQTAGWEIHPDGFALAADTTVPADRLELGVNGSTKSVDTAGPIGIRPLNRRAESSVLILTITYGEGPAAQKIDLTHWQVTARKGQVPAALWGAPEMGDRKPAAEMVPDRITGIQCAQPQPVKPTGPAPLQIDGSIYWNDLHGGHDTFPAPSAPLSGKAFSAPNPLDRIKETINAEQAKQKRRRIAQAFGLKNDELTEIVKNAAAVLQAPPRLGSLGSNPPLRSAPAVPPKVPHPAPASLQTPESLQAPPTSVSPRPVPVLQGVIRHYLCPTGMGRDWAPLAGKVFQSDPWARPEDSGVALPPGVTAVWDWPKTAPGRNASDGHALELMTRNAEGSHFLRVTTLGAFGDVLTDEVTPAGSSQRVYLAPDTARLAVTSLDTPAALLPRHLDLTDAGDGAELVGGWNGLTALTQISPLVLLAPGAAVRLYTPFRARTRRWNTDLGVLPARHLLEQMSQASGAGQGVGQIETYLPANTTTMAVRIRPVGAPSHPPGPQVQLQVRLSTASGPRYQLLQPRPVPAGETGVRWYDLPPAANTGNFVRVLLQTEPGWLPEGVLGYAAERTPPSDWLSDSLTRVVIT